MFTLSYSPADPCSLLSDLSQSHSSLDFHHPPSSIQQSLLVEAQTQVFTATTHWSLLLTHEPLQVLQILQTKPAPAGNSLPFSGRQACETGSPVEESCRTNNPETRLPVQQQTQCQKEVRCCLLVSLLLALAQVPSLPSPPKGPQGKDDRCLF